ncbi:MAG: hypothetical protein MZV64_28445 [Ignavibacteriales bacterium]|nr:hypothetical protein [Ignavibacteriales bacterium]
MTDGWRSPLARRRASTSWSGAAGGGSDSRRSDWGWMRRRSTWQSPR